MRSSIEAALGDSSGCSFSSSFQNSLEVYLSMDAQYSLTSDGADLFILCLSSVILAAQDIVLNLLLLAMKPLSRTWYNTLPIL